MNKFASHVFGALAAVASIQQGVRAAFVINSGSVSGVSDGHATPVGGGATIDDVRVDTPFTTNASQTGGSGGTSGGLGELSAIGSSSVVINVTTAVARGAGGFSLNVHALGSATFDTVNYTGIIGSSLQATLFVSIGGVDPQPFTLAFLGDWASQSTSGVIQASSGGAMISENMIWPGNYVVSVPNANVFAGTEIATPVPTFDGQLLIIVPAPGVGLAAGLAGVAMLARRRR